MVESRKVPCCLCRNGAVIRPEQTDLIRYVDVEVQSLGKVRLPSLHLSRLNVGIDRPTAPDQERKYAHDFADRVDESRPSFVHLKGTQILRKHFHFVIC